MTIEQQPNTQLAITSEQEEWTGRQLAALRQIGVEGAGGADLEVFFHVAKRSGLDPFSRQIYLVNRDRKWVIQTGIDGYRLIAQRAANRNRIVYGIGGPEWCGHDEVWHSVWLPEEYPAAARVVVRRAGETFTGVALWREYVQTTRDRDTGQIRVTRMWDLRAAGQLAKCAEALALRKAFPQDLSGIYVDAELDHANVVRGEVVSGLAHTRAASGGMSSPQPEPEAAGGGGDQREPGPPPPSTSPLLDTSSRLAKAMYAGMRAAGIDEEHAHQFLSEVTGRDITTSRQLTVADAYRVLDHLPQQEEPPRNGGEERGRS